MKVTLFTISVISLLAGYCFGQPGPMESSLCLLQKSVREGEHQTVRVSGLFSEGFEHSLLDDATCPEESTWVEFKLHSQKNKKKLQSLLDKSGKVYLLAEGEFFGPVPPDPSWPETIRAVYPVGWGWLNCRTQLVIQKLIEVKPAPHQSNEQAPN